MTAVYTTKPAKDGAGGSFNAALQDKDGTGASLAVVHALRDASGANVNPATSDLQTAANASLASVDAKLSGPLAVSGTFWQASQPVTGTFWQTTQPVSAASLPLPTGAATAAAQASLLSALGSPLQAGGNVAVTALPALPAGANAIGSVTANAGTNLNTSALALETGGNLAAVATANGGVADTAYTTGSGSIIALLKGIFGKLSSALATTETYVNIAASAAPVSIGQSATLIVGARAGRKEVTLILEAAVAVRIGGSGVTGTTNGVLLQNIAGEAITISGGAAVYGYAPAGTAIVSAVEVY
jgi:hypothetical protein